MRYRFLILLFVLSLSACSFNVDIVTPAATLPPATAPAVIALADTATPIPSASPIPTAISVVTSAPVQQSTGASPIQFAPNGTYVDIQESLNAGSTKTYSVSAMQGQVMSISFLLGPFTSWTVIPLKIVGGDGTILCPTQVNEACYFWRGMLPSTQNYFVTLSPDADVSDFTMRIAIDPPGTSSQSFQYVSQDGRASLMYTDEFAPVLFPELYMTKFTPELALQFIDTKSLDKTNLSEAYFLFDASNVPADVENCAVPLASSGQETVTGEVNVNGISFTRSEGFGAGAGNLYEQTYYRAAYQGSCYEVTFFVHSTNIGNYSPDAGIREFDRAALTQKFEAILSTLVIK